MLFESDFNKYLRSAGNCEETLRIYRQILTRLRKFLETQGIEGVRTVSEANILAFASDLAQQHLAPQTEYHLLSHLKRYFAFLEEVGIIYLSPAEGLRLPKNVRHHHHAYTEEEIRRMLDGLRTDTPLRLRGKAILELAYSSALRPREIRVLNMADVDFAAGRLFIEQAKGKKDRIVPIGEIASSWLRRYVHEIRSPMMKNQRHDAVFISLVTGGPLSAWGLTQAVSQAFVQSGLEPVPLYSLRATAATNLLDRGMNVVHIGRLLGHATIGTTQMYLHTKRRALERVLRTGHPRYHMTTTMEESDHDT